MKKLIELDAAIDALEKVADLFPWKVPGNRDSYDRYNEAWNDAIGRAEIEIEKLPSVQQIPWDKNTRNSMMNTLQMLRRLAYNIHGVMDVIDDDNVNRLIEWLEGKKNDSH